MIIDVRSRLTTSGESSYFRTVMAQRGQFHEIEAFAEGTVEAYFEELSKYSITTAVSVSGNNPGMQIPGGRLLPDRHTSNDLMAELQREHWGRFIGVAGIDAGNVYHNALEELERCHRLGLRCVFIEPGLSPGCDVDDRRLYPIYEKCVELDMAMIPQTSGPWGGKSVDYANPIHYEKVANDFPGLRLILGHACYPYIREAIVVAVRRHNVYLSPDAYLHHVGTEDWLKAVNSNLFGFQDKFLFGTAYPLFPLSRYMDAFWKLPWNPDALPKILYKNALRALKLEEDPTFREMYKLG